MSIHAYMHTTSETENTETTERPKHIHTYMCICLAQGLNERGAPIIAVVSADAEKGVLPTARRPPPAYLGSDPSLKAILRQA